MPRPCAPSPQTSFERRGIVSRSLFSPLQTANRQPEANQQSKVFIQDGKWRQDYERGDVRFVQIRAAGKFWDYDPAKQVAAFQKVTAKTPPAFGGFDVDQFRASLQAALASDRNEDLGIVQENGRAFQKVAFSTPISSLIGREAQQGRLLLTIDRDQALPHVIETQLRRNGVWVTQIRSEFDFVHPVQADDFRITDKNVRIVDLDAYGATVGRRFARPLAQKVFPARTIALRDIQVNRDGDVFVLYTDGSTRDKDAHSYPEISDSLATVYAGTAGGIEPFMYHQEKEMSRGITIGNEILRGECIVPIAPLTGAWKPRTFTIRISVQEKVGARAVTRDAKFTISVAKPTTTLLPDYSGDLATLCLAGGNEKEYLASRLSARCAHFSNERDWKNLIAVTNSAVRDNSADVPTYLTRAEAFHNLGNAAETRASLTAADRQDRQGFYQDQIRRTRQRLDKSNEGIIAPQP